MSRTTQSTSRRDFLKDTGRVALGAPRWAGLPERFTPPKTTRSAWPCSAAAGAAAGRCATRCRSTAGPVKLYAMADLVEGRWPPPTRRSPRNSATRSTCRQDRKFVGFDAYRKAIDLLRPGDIAMCTTRAYIRPVHVEYAVAEGHQRLHGEAVRVRSGRPAPAAPRRAKRPRRRTSRSLPGCSAATRRRGRP